MAYFHHVGEVSTTNGTTVRWTIPGYLEKPQEVGAMLRSLYFVFCGKKRCWLLAFPGGRKSDGSEGWLNISCVIRPLPRGSTLRCSVLDREGKEIMSSVMEKTHICYEKKKWIRTTELEEWRDELLPGGELRIVLRVVPPGRREGRVEDCIDSDEEPESVAEVPAEKKVESSESGSNINNGVENAATYHPVSNTGDSSNKSLQILIKNFKDLYSQGEDCDLTIRVKERQFRTHRLVLKARIPAFCAMLTHDMAENREGVIAIDDCDPDVFSEFLLFVYSGRVENISTGNVCGLYTLADKYGLEDLKETCLEYMKSSLTVDVVCEIISLAATHGEAELLKVATHFFVNNAEEIMETVTWQVFLQENPTQGNELLLKTVKFLETKIYELQSNDGTVKRSLSKCHS